MLAKLFPRFVIKNVIMNSHYARAMAIELVKQPLHALQTEFSTENPSHFYEVKFYGYLASLQAPTQFQNSYEAKQYHEACKKLQEFNDVAAFLQQMSEFYWEVRALYSIVERNNTSSNFLNKKVETDDDFEKDVINSIQKYQKLEADLQAYPEWKDKIVDEIGGLFHIIHNNLTESEAKRNIFLKLNRQEYFI